MQCLGGPVCRPGHKVHASSVMAGASVATDGILNFPARCALRDYHRGIYALLRYQQKATRHPNRVAGLVYLEEGYPDAFENGGGPTMKEFQDIRNIAPQAPSPSESDFASFSALQQHYLRGLGLAYPYGE